MIPKKIHYCWFGGNPLPQLAKECISSWKKFCPDYEIIEWNEDNYDIGCCTYVREAYMAKKWAFVSDYVRLDVVYRYGGIYLDTDVELIKNLDQLLKFRCFLGAEEIGIINTGLGFGAEAKNKCIELMLKEYNNSHFKISESLYDLTSCPKRNTAPFIKLGFTSENRIQKIEEAIIYPPEYFCPMDYRTGIITITDETRSIHHYTASWTTKEDRFYHHISQKLQCLFGKIIGKKLGRIIDFPHRVNVKLKQKGIMGTIIFAINKLK